MASAKALIRPQALGRALNFTTGAMNAMCHAKLAPHNLTLPQWVILSALWQQNGLTVRALAQYTGNNVPATSRILDRMAEKALVARAPDPDDQRSVLIRLAPKGDALRFLDRFHEEVNAALLIGIPPDEAYLIYDLLEQVRQNALKHIESVSPDGA